MRKNVAAIVLDMCQLVRNFVAKPGKYGPALNTQDDQH